MGKGDKKTRRGKIIMGSYGVRRPRKKTKPIVVAKKKPSAPAKATADKPKTKPKAVSKPKATAKPKVTAKPKAKAKK